MKYELGMLEDLAQRVMKGEEIVDLSPLLLAEEARLSKIITENIFSLPTDYLVRQYICWHVDGLVRLADRLYRNGTRPVRFSAGRTLAVVLKVVRLLYHSFPEHMDTAPLPKVLLHKSRSKLSADYRTLEQLFTANGISPKLAAIALAPLEELLKERPHRKTTYNDLLYIHDYVHELKGLDFSTPEYDNKDYVLTDKLIVLNYNTVRVFEYCTAEISGYLRKYGTKEKKEEVLTRVKKILNQLPVMEGVRFDRRFVSVRDALLKWVEEETVFLTTQEERLTVIQERKRLKLRLPVSQIACFAALSYKHGVYHETDKKAIIRHYVDTYASKETDRISEGSFLNSFKKPTDRAARGLRTLLRKMLDDLDDFLN